MRAGQVGGIVVGNWYTSIQNHTNVMRLRSGSSLPSGAIRRQVGIRLQTSFAQGNTMVSEWRLLEPEEAPDGTRGAAWPPPGPTCDTSWPIGFQMCLSWEPHLSCRKHSVCSKSGHDPFPCHLLCAPCELLSPIPSHPKSTGMPLRHDDSRRRLLATLSVPVWMEDQIPQCTGPGNRFGGPTPNAWTAAVSVESSGISC